MSSILLDSSEEMGVYAPTRDTHSIKNVAAVILAGGNGTRLFPLTQACCKPALSFGGSFKLIDIPVSNALNSGCNKIFILSQYLSASLHQHILRTYRIDPFQQGFIELLSPEQRPKQHVWYQGTADAVRQNLGYLLDTSIDYFLILSGDQLYTMDFNKMLSFAQSCDADFVVSALPVEKARTQRMGILQVNEQGFITDFLEKPTPSDIEPYLFDQAKNLYLGSMGIYLIKRSALLKMLQEDVREDFGKHLIPTQVKKGSVAAYIHQGYWEDIGTIEAFYQANIDLTARNPAFDCFNEKHPIYRASSLLPGPKIFDTQIRQALLSEGSQIEAKSIYRSIIGPKSQIGKGTVIECSYLMGNDSYTSFAIGSNCIIRNAILDKNVRIGNNVILTNQNKLKHYDGPGVFIRDGILVVSRNTTLADGFTL